MELNGLEWVLSYLAAFIIGINKGGIKGIEIFFVTILLFIFGAKASTGIIVPMLVAGDIFAALYYGKHTQWRHILRMLPFMVIGILIGVFIGKDLPEVIFRKSIAIIVIVSAVLMYLWDRRKSDFVPSHLGFAGFLGTMSGITTMVANLAGAFSNIYFLAMRLPKIHFIGTVSWLFFFINTFKLPFHLFVWETVDKSTLMLNLKLLPAMLIGLPCGVYLLSLMQENTFRQVLIFLIALGGIIIFFR